MKARNLQFQIDECPEFGMLDSSQTVYYLYVGTNYLPLIGGLPIYRVLVLSSVGQLL